MSTTGRGRGRGGTAKPNDRSPSSSSGTSSRSPSITRPLPPSSAAAAAATGTQDADRLMKELKTKFTATAGNPAALGANRSTVPKFVPNLAALKKDKDKPNSTPTSSTSASSINSSSTNRKDHLNGNKSQLGRGAGGHSRGGFGRGNYVQMEGIFQGNAQIPVSSSTPSFGGRGSSGKRESSAASLRLPNIKKLGTAKTTVIGDVDGLKYEIDEEYEPRQIPIAERKSVFDVKKEPGTLHKIKEPLPTSEEHVDSFIRLFSQHTLDASSKSIVKDEPVEPTEAVSPPPSVIDPSQLILMQFPDVLPCTRTSSSSKPELASLTDLPDGFLGKLQIFKSGKCRLKLNDDTYLDVDIGQSTSFLQNVMVTEMASTTTNTHVERDPANSSDMNKLVCLGDIKHKLIVSLDVDHVLEDAR